MRITNSKRWDYIVVTACDERQRELYEGLLFSRRFHDGCRVLCISDGDGEKIGSGGAFLKTLAEISKLCDGDFSTSRILLINSGGFSKRCLPNAACGKVFAPFALDSTGHTATLFDAIVSSFDSVLPQINAGMIISTGDIVTGKIPQFDSLQNTLFCMRTDADTAASYGAAFCDEDGFISDYLQKRSAQLLRKTAELYAQSDVYVDTGAVYLTGEYLTSVFGLIAENGKLSYEKLALLTDGTPLSFYSDFLSLMSTGCQKYDYLNEASECNSPDKIRRVREIVFDCLSGKTAKVLLLDGKFYHYGTAKEYLENIMSPDAASAASFDALPKTSGGYILLNSAVDESCKIMPGTLVRNSVLGDKCRIGCGCIVSDIKLENISLPHDSVLFGLRMKSGSYVAVSYDISMNPKLPDGDTIIWEKPLFFEGLSYADSYEKFLSDAPQVKVSLKYCFENLEYSCCTQWSQLVSDLRESGYTSSAFPLMKNIDTLLKERVSRIGITQVFSPVKSLACCSLPVRVNLSGTWTDFYPYCADNGGAVVNVAVMPDGKLPVTATAQTINSPVIELCCADSGRHCTVASFDELWRLDEFSEFGLHRAALLLRGFDSITRLEKGLRLTTMVSGVMSGSGLGASSILLFACLKVLDELSGRCVEESELFGDVFLGEQLMKTCGGWQDQCGGYCGGFKYTATRPGMPQKINLQKIAVPDEFIDELERRFVLISTQERHYGRFIAYDVAKRYADGNPLTLRAFEKLCALNDKVLHSLSSADAQALSDCMNEHFAALREVSPLISNEKIDRIADVAMRVCSAVCICGAGGGGYLQALLHESNDVEALRLELEKEFGKNDARVKTISLR